MKNTFTPSPNFLMIGLGLFFIFFTSTSLLGQDKIVVDIGHIHGIGNFDGIYEKSSGVYKPPPAMGVPENNCYCWTQKGGNYSIANIGGNWTVFNLSHCPTSADNLSSISYYPWQHKKFENCDPTVINGIEELKMNLIIPAYVHPYDEIKNLNNVYWDKIYEAASALQQQLVVIITLPNPINSGDVEGYKVVIDELQRRNARVLGYIPLYFGERSETLRYKKAIKDYRIKWYNTFDIDGIFYDEAHLTKHASFFPSLYEETQNMNPAKGKQLVIFNPGVPTNNSVWNGHKGWFVPSESNETTFNNRKTRLESMDGLQKSRSLILVHGMSASTWNAQFNYLKNNDFYNIFLTDDIYNKAQNLSPWDDIPTFFNAMLNEF